MTFDTPQVDFNCCQTNFLGLFAPIGRHVTYVVPIYATKLPRWERQRERERERHSLDSFPSRQVYTALVIWVNESGTLVDDTDRAKTDVFGGGRGKHVSLPLCPPQISRGKEGVRTRGCDTKIKLSKNIFFLQECLCLCHSYITDSLKMHPPPNKKGLALHLTSTRYSIYSENFIRDFGIHLALTFVHLTTKYHHGCTFTFLHLNFTCSEAQYRRSALCVFICNSTN